MESKFKLKVFQISAKYNSGILNSIDYLLNNPKADQWVCNDDQDRESSELSDDIAKNVYN